MMNSVGFFRYMGQTPKDPPPPPKPGSSQET